MSGYLSSREKKIFMICLAAIVLVVFYNGLVGPLEEKKNVLDQEIMSHKKLLDRDLKDIQTAEDFRDQYHGYLKRFGVTGDNEEAVSAILSDIEKTVHEFGLYVTELKPDKIQQEVYHKHFSVSLAINSDWVDIIRFLYKLQQPPYLFEVEEIEFEQSVNKGRSMVTTRLDLGRSFILPGANENFVDHVANTEEPPGDSLTADQFNSFKLYEDGIKARNLFQSLRDGLKPESMVLSKTHPALHERIKIVGILIDGDSKAIVEDLKEKQVHFLSKGERVGSILLEDIQENKVTFLYDNKRVEMTP